MNLGEWFQVISGVLLIVTLITNPEGIAAAGHEIADRWARWKASRRAGEVVAERPTVAPVPPPAVVAADGNGSALQVDHLTVRYGGVVAVSDVSLRVEPGQIVGLIGPNGAGKTSVIGTVTGFAPRRGVGRAGRAEPDRARPARHAPASPARSSPSSSTTTCRSRRTSAWPRSAAGGPRQVARPLAGVGSRGWPSAPPVS